MIHHIYFQIYPNLSGPDTHNFVLTNRRLSNSITDGFDVNTDRNEIIFNQFTGIQRERESLFFSLPPKFRGNKVSLFGLFLCPLDRFVLSVILTLEFDLHFENLNLADNLRMVNASALIFHMSFPCNKTFRWTPTYLSFEFDLVFWRLDPANNFWTVNARHENSLW